MASKLEGLAMRIVMGRDDSIISRLTPTPDRASHLRPLYFNSEDEQDDSTDGDVDTSLESNSSSSSTGSVDVLDFPPRVTLLHLPVEILEYVAESLRDPVYPVLDSAAVYLSDRYTDLSETSLDLSAFSQVTSAVRRTVERILYRDVHLDFTGWKGRKHPRWPAGSLRLLLRTLEGRPDLGRYIYGASLDWHHCTNSQDLERGLEEFLSFCPNLTKLFLVQCPTTLWECRPLPTLTFATSYAPGILPSILEQFPKLQNLYLCGNHRLAFSGPIPEHNLRTLRTDSSNRNAAAHFRQVLELCGDTVHDLDVRFGGSLLVQAPYFVTPNLPLSLRAGTNLRTLRLDNISVLSHIGATYAQLLGSLPVLQHLHLSHHSCFSTTALSLLPVSLHSLTISHYYGVWEIREADAGDEFMLALSSCIAARTRSISQIVAARFDPDATDFGALHDICKLENIEYSEIEGDEYVHVLFGNS